MVGGVVGWVVLSVGSEHCLEIKMVSIRDIVVVCVSEISKQQLVSVSLRRAGPKLTKISRDLFLPLLTITPYQTCICPSRTNIAAVQCRQGQFPRLDGGGGKR